MQRVSKFLNRLPLEELGKIIVLIKGTAYEYVWQSQSHVMDCRYIKFGWF